MATTDNFGFGLIESLPDLLRSYNGDITVIDTLLKIIGSPSDGESVTVDEPVDPAVLAPGIGGDLAAEVEYFYTYTFVDPANGLESAPAPEESVTLPAEFSAPAAPTLAPTTTGGDLTPGTYSYLLSYWVGFNTMETSAVDSAEIVLHPADGNEQIITLTLPALGDATGFNVYRKRPGMSSYYFIGSVTGAGPTFVDDGLGVEDCERFAPVYSNILSSFGVNVDIDTVPTGYHWKLYRSTESGEYSDSLIATITDASPTFTDSGFETTYGTPPAVTPVLIPGTVGLRSGVGAPTAPDGNDGDWWIDTDSMTLYGPKDAGAWPASGTRIGGGVLSAVFLHVDNLDLTQPHPVGAFLPANWVVAELIGQDNPAENGTYMTPANPAVDPLILASAGNQGVDLQNISKPYVFTYIISRNGAPGYLADAYNFWPGSHELFVRSHPISGDPILAFQQGTSTLARTVVDEDPTVGFVPDTPIGEGNFVLAVDSSGAPTGSPDNGGLWIYKGDSTPLQELQILTTAGVFTQDPIEGVNWTLSGAAWTVQIPQPGAWNVVPMESGWIDPTDLGGVPEALRWRFTDPSRRRVEVGGAAVYAPGATPVPTAPTTPALMGTLPAEALPSASAGNLPFTSIEWDVLSTGGKVLAGIELNSLTGEFSISGTLAYAAPMFLIPYFTYDVV